MGAAAVVVEARDACGGHDGDEVGDDPVWDKDELMFADR